jgi:hypothetical protein
MVVCDRNVEESYLYRQEEREGTKRRIKTMQSVIDRDFGVVRECGMNGFVHPLRS